MGQLIDINTRRRATAARHEPELNAGYCDSVVSGPGDLQRFIGDIRSRADLERLYERIVAYDYWCSRAAQADLLGGWPSGGQFAQMEDIPASAIRRIMMREAAPPIGRAELVMSLQLPPDWITDLPVDDRCLDLRGEEGVRSCAVPMPAYKNHPRFLLCEEALGEVWKVYDVLAEPPNTWPRCMVTGFDDRPCQRLV